MTELAGVTQARVIRSEWIKFWSLRSTTVTLATAVALLVGIGLLAAGMLGSGDIGGPGPGPGNLGPVAASLAGLTFAQLAFGTLGVLFMASEYGTGMIRSSLTAVPRRLPVLWGKIAVFGGVVLVVGLAAAAIAFTGGQAVIGGGGASWSGTGVARAVIGSAVILAQLGRARPRPRRAAALDAEPPSARCSARCSCSAGWPSYCCPQPGVTTSCGSCRRTPVRRSPR
nr:hypothetical protein GCM10020092_102020 [Actinoplanes digitatis]